MRSTSYLPLQPIARCSPGYVGGFCRWWYTPIENIATFSDVNPDTQQLLGQPVLKAGAVWFGPVDVPDQSRGWLQQSQKAKAGPWQKQIVTGVVPGNSINSHINLDNSIFHQFCVVAKLRAGGFFIIFGNEETGMDLATETDSGKDQFDTPGTKLTLNWEGQALILPAFNGVASQVAPVGSGIVPVNDVDSITYTADGTEGNTITLPALAGRIILLLARESMLLNEVSGAVGVRDFKRDITGTTITFLADLAPGEVIKILFK